MKNIFKKSNWIKFLFVLILSIGVIGCGPSTTTSPTGNPQKIEDIAAFDLTWYLKHTNNLVPINDYIIADGDYSLVDEDWFKQNILNTFNDFLFNNGVLLANKKKNDCDDFARAFSFYTRIKSMQCSAIDYDMAVADVYLQNFDFGHAINMVVVLDKNGNKKVIFIEPQGPKIITLTDQQKTEDVSYIGL